MVDFHYYIIKLYDNYIVVHHINSMQLIIKIKNHVKLGLNLIFGPFYSQILSFKNYIQLS
jgi:hypothetical protein